MLTFIEPDVTQYPSNFEVVKCPGLEALTGADMCISRLPILPNEKNLQMHIGTRALFVQIKIGYDITPDDRLKSSIARMMACRIPKGQAILLPIGEYWQDKEGLLRVKGKVSFGTTLFTTLATIFDMWRFRGGEVHCDDTTPKHIDDLQKWIDQKEKSILKIESEGTRDIYPPSPEFIPEDIWQSVEEIDDWRNLLVSGLKGFGSAKANAVWKYASDNFSENPISAYHIFTLMTDEDEKGKAVHNIPLWGEKSRKEFRELLRLGDGWNLSELAYRIAFYQGWKSFGLEFARLVNKDKRPNEVHKQLMNESATIDLERNIPF